MFSVAVFLSLFALTGTSEGGKICPNGSCFNLNEGEISAEAGLCVVILCSLNVTSGYKTQNMTWFKCEPSKQKCELVMSQPEFKGQVSLLESDLSRNNCSIIITDLTQSDSGPYQIRVEGLVVTKSKGFAFNRKLNVSVTGMKCYNKYTQ